VKTADCKSVKSPANINTGVVISDNLNTKTELEADSHPFIRMENERAPLTEGVGGARYTESKENQNHNQTQEHLSADDESAFICNICLDITNKDPVVTQCGHLYCWPCLYRWLNTNHTTCPVCKAGVSRENIIPLFIRGSEQDPRCKTPPRTEGVPDRPAGRRPEAQQFDGTNNNQGGGMTFSAGLGFFPSLFGLQFQYYASSRSSQRDPQDMTRDEITELYLSRLLVVLGTVVILALIFF
jgi:E3 ubiquitin-protein ligase RNF5